MICVDNGTSFASTSDTVVVRDQASFNFSVFLNMLNGTRVHDKVVKKVAKKNCVA